MRTVNKNKQSLKYSKKGSRTPIYERNIDGTIKKVTIDGVQVPVETGEYKIGFGTPVGFKANIAESGGDSVAVEYGLDYSSYDAIIVTAKGELPIKEADIVWSVSTPTYDNDGNVNENSADYRIVKKKTSLNVDKYILEKVIK